MYQNAPPPQYNNQGGYPQQQQQQYGGNPGYYDQQQQQPINNQYNNTQPSPVNAAYQRANAAMTRGPSPSPNIGGSPLTGGNAGGPNNSSSAASGLIRLTLRKPMGIVFEPMTDPHNPSQQRGVRICDLPRTGAAAMSLKLQVGDELLSINDKTMSRLTFDEIMDFIIEADKERVDLLFRRPTKAQVGAAAAPQSDPMGPGEPSSPTGLGGIGSQSNSVKWIDEKSDLGARGKLAAAEDSTQEEPRSNKGRGSNKHSARDEYSVDDEGTYDDGGYTVESQSQYTMETYEEDTRGGGRKGRGGGRYNSRRDRDHRRDSRSSRHRDRDDPMESGGFLDLLIDTLCTGVMGRDARDMCGDGRSGKSRRSSKYDDDDDDFTLDDGTYATYEEDSRRRGGRHNEDESLATNEDTFVTEDDGTRTLEEQEEWRKHRQKSKEESKKSSSSSSKSKNNKIDQQDQFDDDGFMAMDNQFQSAGMNDPPLNHMPSAPDPPTKMASQSRDNIRMAASAPISNQQQQPQIIVDHQMNEHESAIASGMPLPVKELEYVDGHDYAADVSVMESLGGPSLLVERARHENAVGAGADRANFESLEMQDPELGELVAKHGEGFTPDPGMTKDETAFRDPYKFYEFAVCNLLKENEPEKVRLLSKLMAKYRGRERHLINKLSARYNKDKTSDAEDEAAGAPTVGKSKSNASEASNAANKQSMKSGMDKIQEGDDGEEGSSFLNDPSRANMAAIEAAKKKMENAKSDSSAPQDEGGIPNKKSSNDDGWPPAMSDPWGGAGGQAATSSAAARDTSTSNNDEEDGSRSRPMHDDDEGSFSGSSYTESGDEVDGTSPAIIAQVSELLNYVYGKTSVAGQIDRVSTIMRAYEGREAVLLELLETKALIKANADSNNQEDLPTSLRNAPGLKTSSKENGDGNNNAATTTTGGPPKKLTPSTPSGVSVLTAPTMAGGTHPASSQVSPTATAGGDTISPSANTLNSTTSKKKKKGVFGGFFGGKKKDKKSASKGKASPQGKSKNKKTNKKGQQLNNDDGSI